MIDIRFIVDNPGLLARNFLELGVSEGRIRRRLIGISPDAEKFYSGQAQVPVASGPTKITVCGFVKCGETQDPEMICGDSEIPSFIEVDKIHEIHFSTNWACRNSTLVSPLVKSQ